MRKTYPEIPFERYADDIVCLCPTQVSSAKVLSAIDHRFSTCGLSINKDKTKIVYCKLGGGQKLRIFASFTVRFLGRVTKSK